MAAAAGGAWLSAAAAAGAAASEVVPVAAAAATDVVPLESDVGDILRVHPFHWGICGPRINLR